MATIYSEQLADILVTAETYPGFDAGDVELTPSLAVGGASVAPFLLAVGCTLDSDHAAELFAQPTVDPAGQVFRWPTLSIDYHPEAPARGAIL